LRVLLSSPSTLPRWRLKVCACCSVPVLRVVSEGGCGHRLCATWPITRNGSHHQRAPVSSLALHTPFYRSPRLPTRRSGNEVPVARVLLHGGARASRSGPDPPIRGLSRVRAGRRRGFTPLPATYGCNGGGGGLGGHQISRNPLTELEPPHWGGKGPPGPAHVLLVFGHR